MKEGLVSALFDWSGCEPDTTNGTCRSGDPGEMEESGRDDRRGAVSPLAAEMRGWLT